VVEAFIEGCAGCRMRAALIEEREEWFATVLADVLADRDEQIAVLKAEVIRLRHGHQSERLGANGRTEPGGQPPASSPGGGRGQRAGRPGHGRRRQEHLPLDEVVVEPAADQLCCERCGAPFEPFGEDSGEQIDWQVVVRRVRHRRPRYRRTCGCPGRAIVQAPPPPQVVPKGMFTAGFIAHLLILKYGVGLPVQRVITLLAMEGLELSPGTLAGVLSRVGVLLAPLARAIREHNRASDFLHADETSWPVFTLLEGKDGHFWWLWVFVGPDSVCYLVKPRRSTVVAAEHLGIDLDSPLPALPEVRDLVLHSDRFSVYESLGLKVPGVINLWCWAHVRRDFVGVRDRHPALRLWATGWLERIAGLYRAYRCWEPDDPDVARADERRRAVAERVEEMRRGLDRELANRRLRAPARKVLASLDRFWEGLVLPFEEPGLALDNNAAERALRGPVVGRKNYYDSGARWSAELAADAWTVLATWAMAGWDQRRHLLDYLDACAQSGGRPPDRMKPWLPWAAGASGARWAKDPPDTS
jgi:transposase